MLAQKAKNIIEDIIYITIATVCPDGTPWNTPVYTAYDSNLNFYWASWTQNQHSKNIEQNNSVFCILYDSRAPEGTGEGVYLKGNAYALTSPEEIIHGLRILNRRGGKENGDERPDPFIKGIPRKIYKFTPHECWMNDEGSEKGEYVDIRHKVNLSDLKKELKSRA